MAKRFIGRENEVKIFDRLLDSEKAEFLVMYGRRRVGKTFLIREYFSSKMVFDFSGAFGAELDLQLDNFFNQYMRWTEGKKETSPPTSWNRAFTYLADYLYSLKHRKRKIVVFIDELPWLDSPRSGFISAFEYFWNQHVSNMDNVLLVVCGSAASWIKNKLIKAKGGLYNRITQKIHLKPFNLHETELFCKRKRIKLTRYQIIQLYMVMGGIPHYLNALEPGKSASQLINSLCFTEHGLLIDEYDQLYASLFKNADDHISIVEALSQKPQGLDRKDLVKFSGLPDGGTFNRALTELIDSGFVSVSRPFQKKKKDSIFRLIDLYTLFYLKYIQHNRSRRDNIWHQIEKSSSFKAWSGYAFENICHMHLDQIHQKLGISGVYTESGAWKNQGTKELPGAQIDLLIDRADDVINLCEAKFTKQEFIISKSYAADLRRKRAVFQQISKTRKLVVNSLITTFPAIQNEYYHEEIHSEISIDDLFTDHFH